MSNVEIHIKGQAVSRGAAIGKAVCLYGRRRQYFHTALEASQVEKELRRFRAAVRLAIKQLGRLTQSNGKGSTENAASILETHRMMLSDPAVLNEIEEKISIDMVNAEWAVKLVTDGYIAQFKAMPDETFRERHADIEDVTERILTALGGGRRTRTRLQPGSVIVAREIDPSALIELSENDPVGIITEHGGWTSHTFILARELGIPAITGVRRALRRIQTGDGLIINGFRGEIIVRPSDETLEKFKDSETIAKNGSSTDSNPLLKTLDGRQITIRANADIPGGLEKARAAGASGIGLLRSEYAFNRFRGIPSENEQYEAYHRIALLTGEDGVRIRTFDFGSDDLNEQPAPKQKNPALGLRAIRLSLDHEKQFREQLRALLRASNDTTIDIIVPMISDLSEIIRVKEILAEEQSDLAASNIPAGSPRVGVMVEVPSAVFIIEEILDEAETICLGTNDLVQYLLAVDRDNESVSEWFRTLSPAVIRAVKKVLDACNKRGVSCVVCGEMAGSPYYVPLLIGLGATELSMNPNSVARIRSLISNVAYDETVRLVRQIENCRTAAEVEATNRRFIAANWSHLYQNNSLS
jgi:phosphoenolpyruvate-protein phosphotransferase